MKTSLLNPNSRGEVGYSLWWLIIGRVAAALLLLTLSSASWSRHPIINANFENLHATLPIFLVVVALSLLYSIFLRYSEQYDLQIILQIVGDVLISSWLVWVTGDVHSPYTALYIIIIPVAGYFAGPRGALVSSVGCGIAFTTLMLATVTGLIPKFYHLAVEDSLSKIIQTVGLNDVAFLVVGLLSARLAERQWRTDVRLIAATQTLANLRALHERIVESIRSGVVTTDLEGRIFTFNAAAAEITGYSANEVRGQEVSIFFGDLRAQIAESAYAAEVGRTSPRFESECVTFDGLRLCLGFTIFPLHAESGEISGYVITFQDMTQVRALEETSRRQDRLAAVGRMAASIAHEIRNPLAAMRGSIQVLHSEVAADSSQAQLMDIILRESDRLNRIITDYLHYARPRSTVTTTVDLRELVSETFTLLRHSPEIQENHRVEVEVPEEALMADVDAGQMKQVFWNIARNAVQAMHDGGTLKVNLSRGSAGRLVITFADSGRGMTPEQVERLFEPFSSTTGGTGLGLSIVYQIIRDHSGTIHVRSLEGQGTTITIELPGAKQPSDGSRVPVVV